jgi:hypothetical protein
MLPKVTLCGNDNDAEFEECFDDALARGNDETQAHKLGLSLLFMLALLMPTTSYQSGPVLMGYSEKDQLSVTTTSSIDIASQFQHNHYSFTGPDIYLWPTPGMLSFYAVKMEL